MVSGYNERKEGELKEAWLHTRALSWHIVRGYADPKKLPATIDLWWPLDGSKPKVTKLSKAQIAKAKELHERLNKHTNG